MKQIRLGHAIHERDSNVFLSKESIPMECQPRYEFMMLLQRC